MAKTLAKQMVPQIDRLVVELDKELRPETFFKDAPKELRKMLAPVRKKVARAVPVNPNRRPGKTPLSKTFIVKIRRYNYGERYMGYVGPRWPQGAHGHLVEDGTQEHSTTKGSSVKKGTGQDGPGKHPGAKARLFFAPVWNAEVYQLNRQVTRYMLDTMNEHFRKAAK